ncbi:type II toxin-antitoxin system prevent-host-death family antitoxin [Nocardia fluminea]|uniref:type II toxin-antitoxin system prevent-host-death family antitoxin n=1 Tax=Nocardia fluminea TaxID=134984 RepID=UPI0033DFB8DC
MSAREFDQDVSAAKSAAEEPVVSTDRGEDAFVLSPIDEYRRLKGDSQYLVRRLSMDDEIEFEPTPLQVDPRVADL